MRILVTGGTGFVGKHALEALGGMDLHATHIEEKPPPIDGVIWHRADLLRDPADVMRRVQPTHVLHLAWYTVHGKFWTSEENLRWVSATIELMRAFRGERFVGAGTCAEYAWEGAEPLNERTTPLAPKTLYGVSKDCVRRMLEAHAAARSMSWSWGRLFFLYGPEEHPDRFVASVLGALVRGETARCTHGTQVRDFMHAQDAGRAFAALLLSNVEGPVNIATGVAVTLRQIAERARALVGKGDVAFGAIPARADDPPFVVADASRLKQEVGFAPRTLDEGLRDILAQWRG
jgi:nucleoside-diphosphate-sugar epimerase